MQVLMNNPKATPVHRSLPNTFAHEGQFWLKAIHSWKEVIDRLVRESAEIKASPVVTAEVARIAGELSLLAERLIPLEFEIEQHLERFPLICKADGVEEGEFNRNNQSLYDRVLREGDLFRNLLSEMFQLEQSAYKRFLS